MTTRPENLTFTMVKVLAIIASGILFSGCQTTKPIYTVETVDLERFMGDWFVIASIPTYIEKDAYNAVESYHLRKDGTIAVTYKFNQGGLDGPLRVKTYRGFVQDRASNAVWGYELVWPFRAEYRIIYLNSDYSQTVIGRSKRDYVWIMARGPKMPEKDYERI